MLVAFFSLFSSLHIMVTETLYSRIENERSGSNGVQTSVSREWYLIFWRCWMRIFGAKCTALEKFEECRSKKAKVTRTEMYVPARRFHFQVTAQRTCVCVCVLFVCRALRTCMSGVQYTRNTVAYSDHSVIRMESSKSTCSERTSPSFKYFTWNIYAASFLIQLLFLQTPASNANAVICVCSLSKQLARIKPTIRWNNLYAPDTFKTSITHSIFRESISRIFMHLVYMLTNMYSEAVGPFQWVRGQCGPLGDRPTFLWISLWY